MIEKFCDEKIAKLKEDHKEIEFLMSWYPENSYAYARFNLGLAMIACKIGFWKAVKR